MSYSRRQLEALGEPFGSCATRVKPGGYGRIYGVGNEPEPEGSRPSGEDYYYQTGTMGSGPYGGQPAGFMVANPEYTGAEYVPYTGEGKPSGDDYYYQSGSMSGPGGYMVANPEYQADVPAYVPYVAPTTTAAATSSGGGAAPNVQQQTAAILQEKLGTAPTQDQVNYWGGIFGLDNQITPDEVARLDSAIGNAGNTPGPSPTGNAVVSGGGGNTGWINAGGDTLFSGNTDQIRNYISGLYTNELKRPADDAGLNWWTSQIAADGKVSQDELNAWRAAATKSGETLVTPTKPITPITPTTPTTPTTPGGTGQGTAPPPGFLGARPLFTGVRNPFYEGSDTRSDLVNMAYQRLLNRPPDEAGLANYSQEMTRGLTGQGLVSALANSPEFQRTQDFQRAYTSTFRPGYQEFGPSGQYNQPIYLSSYTDYARSPGFIQPQYNTEMMTPQDVGYGFGSFNPFAYGGTNPFAGDTAAPVSPSAPSGSSTAAARGGRIKDDDGITALLKR